MGRPTKERIREVLDEVNAMDLSDAKHWHVVHRKLGLRYGDVFDLMLEDREFFGIKPLPAHPVTEGEG